VAVVAIYLVVVRKQKEKKRETTSPFKDTPYNDPKPPTRPHLLMAPPPPNSTMGWDQASA
jgi:hypothetical protein